MAITSLDQLITASKQKIQYTKTASRTSVAGIPFTTFDLAGDPPAATLALANTANGLVPTDATVGFPTINDFGAGNTGYVSGALFGLVVPQTVILYDRLFNAGAYSFNSAVTLTTQPSYSGRVPGGTDFTNTEIWLETVTAFTGNITVAVTYTNQSGTTGRTTGTFAPAVAPTIGRILVMPLQAGDSGVQKIESVTATVATVGTFNVVVARPLCIVRANATGIVTDALGFERIGLPQIFQDSALALVVQTDSTATNNFWMTLDVING